MSKRIPINRRQFLGLGALATVSAAAGMGGCASGGQAKDQSTDTPAVDEGATSPSTPSFMEAPDPITDDMIGNTVEAEVVVVGAGVSGLCAARSAAEAGATVAVIEKGETYQFRSGQYGIHGSSLQNGIGMTYDGTAAVLDLMKEMGYRPNQRILNYWRDKSGEVFDWFLEPAGDTVEVVAQDALDYDPEKISILTPHFPPPAAYNPSQEYSPTFPQATLCFLPDQGGILELNYQKSLDLGVEYHFANWARQLVRPDQQGRVEGVIAEDSEGNYTKFTASKAVILCTGDYGSDEEMVAHYCGGRTYTAIFSNVDANGEPTNTGDGHKLALWAGAKIEDGPHAPMTHTLGGALGTDAFFMANNYGYRFCNEDVAGQQLSTQIYRQPGDFAWQIFDDKYPEQVEYMGAAHGSVNHIVDESANPHLEGADMTLGRSALSSREEVEAYEGFPVPDGFGTVKADTLEELVSKMEMDEEAQANLLASIARYNELCAKGNDDDFGKVSSRMFSVSTPPFYACKIAAGVMLVCLGGVSVDAETLKAVDANYQPIEGLYAAGNTMGCRVLQDYPVTIGGISHAMAMLFGKMTGELAATA